MLAVDTETSIESFLVLKYTMEIGDTSYYWGQSQTRNRPLIVSL